MPTRDGDIVIAHREGSAFEVWLALLMTQQPGPDSHANRALGRLGALKLGRMLARHTRGAVFVMEADGLTWNKVSE